MRNLNSSWLRALSHYTNVIDRERTIIGQTKYSQNVLECILTKCSHVTDNGHHLQAPASNILLC
jgi:hypothetical protein